MRIQKRHEPGHPAPSLRDYERARATFSWKALGVEIPEEDYGKIATLGEAVAYVSARAR